MRDRDPLLCREFVAYTKNLLAAHPEIIHTWPIDEDEDHCVLDITAASADGFNITVEVFPSHIAVLPHGMYSNFDLETEPKEIIEEAIRFVCDLLSPSMRIKEYLASGSPYKWDAEKYKNGKWEREDTSYLAFWNYFGSRSERFLQNHILESRKS